MLMGEATEKMASLITANNRTNNAKPKHTNIQKQEQIMRALLLMPELTEEARGFARRIARQNDMPEALGEAIMERMLEDRLHGGGHGLSLMTPTPLTTEHTKVTITFE